MTTLWIEPFGGLAGDMLLGALLDLGDPRFTLEHLERLAEELVPGEARLRAEEVWRGSMRGTLLTVLTPESGSSPHRRLADLEQLLGESSLSDRARARAASALLALAEAEARVHGTTPADVHFHEVGAVDTLVDIGGAALALDLLAVEDVRASEPLVGSGTVRCAHGEMPVPAPAVAELLRGRPIRTGGGCERTTPTGAALLAAWTPVCDSLHSLTSRAVGYGAGHSDPSEGPPNLVRVQLVEATANAIESAGEARGEAWLLEFNLDDMSAEEVGHAVGALRSAGALEAWTVPVQMKKDRPGVVVSALARAADRAALEAEAFRWTTTFGVRWTRVERAECGRRHVEVTIEGVSVRVKVRERAGSDVLESDLAPEHDDLVRVAQTTGLALRELRHRAIEAALGAMR